MGKALYYLLHPNKFILRYKHKKLTSEWGRRFSDEEYLCRVFKLKMGKKLNLKDPQTFNEKIQWLKLYDRKPEYTKMVDKYEAKNYVAERIGEQYIIPTLGVWESFGDIDFESLPEQFVLKCTHDSGGLVICRDKENFNIEEARRKIETSLKREYYWLWREWPYKNVKPRIIAEKYMEDSKTSELRDYKFFCCNGEVKCFKIDFDRFTNHCANYYDIQMNQLPFGEAYYPPNYNKKLAEPKNLEQMIALATLLSKDVPFLRVDFYNVDDEIYFGELTFYPAAGCGPFTSEEWDKKLGDWIKLPEKQLETEV